MTTTPAAPASPPQSPDDKVNRAILDAIPIDDHGQPQYATFGQLIEQAKVMLRMGAAVGPHCRGNQAMCIFILMQARRWGLDPYMVSRKTYVTESKKDGRLSLEYESQLIHAILETHAPLQERLRVRYDGDGDMVTCTVYGTLKGEAEPREWTSQPLKTMLPAVNESGWSSGSPLWRKKPRLQLYYDTCRDWGRVYCPDVIAGLYAPEEFEEYGNGGGSRPAPTFKTVANPLGEAPSDPIGTALKNIADAGSWDEMKDAANELKAATSTPPPPAPSPPEQVQMPATLPELCRGDMVRLAADQLRVTTAGPDGAKTERGVIQRGDVGEVMGGPDKLGLYVIAWATLPGFRVTVRREKLALEMPSQLPPELTERLDAITSAQGIPSPSQQSSNREKSPAEEIFTPPYSERSAAEYEAYARRWIDAAVLAKMPANEFIARWQSESPMRTGLGEAFEAAQWRPFSAYYAASLEKLQPEIE